MEIPATRATVQVNLEQTLFVALELSRAKWLVGTYAPILGDKINVHTIAGGDAQRLLGIVSDLRNKMLAKGASDIRITSCYEAGYDGFWLHRVLVRTGIENYVLDAASLLVDRRAKQIKTDNIDVRRLMRALVGFVQGDRQSCRVVTVPTVEQEDAKRLHRERTRLVHERTSHSNRIKGLLMAHGIRGLRLTDKTWIDRLDRMRTGDGRALPAALRIEIEREWRRLRLVAEQLRDVEAVRNDTIQQLVDDATGDVEVKQKMQLLIRLRGIGPDFATIMMREAFYRKFQNRRQVASYFGLAPAPHDSGDSQRCQGISKAGNPRARCAAIGMAWMWLRHQPQSELAQWFAKRAGGMSGRVRRIMVVGLARKLVIALWRYVETGEVPQGAIVSQ